MPKSITERFAYQGGKVDRTGPRPIIRGVLLCGATSANRRRYRKEAFAGSNVQKYADRPVYLNHGDGRTARSYEHQVGWVRNPRLNAAGMPIGDLEVKPKHPLAEQLLDDAENDPRAVGMSHVAQCETAPGADGFEEVKSIVHIESVDIVLDPATTKGFFESTGSTSTGVGLAGSAGSGRREPTQPTHPGETKMIKLRVLLERITNNKRAPERTRQAARRLREMGAAPGLMDAPAADAGPDPVAGIKSAFLAACTYLIQQALDGDLDVNAALSKVRKMIVSHSAVNAQDQDTTTDADTPGTDAADDGDGAVDPNDGVTDRADEGRARRRRVPTGAKEFAEMVREPGVRLASADTGFYLPSVVNGQTINEAFLAHEHQLRERPSTVPTDPTEFAASMRD